MAVRDVVDEKGTKWKVWLVSAASIHPRTAAEDFLGDYADGWLCFESDKERRRLARFPQDWDKLPEKALIGLIKTAQIVQAHRHTPPRPGPPVKP